MKKLAGFTVCAAISALLPAFASQSPEPISGGIGLNQAQILEDRNVTQAAPNQVAMAPAVSAPDQTKLNLSDEQLEKIKTLKSQLADSAGPKRLELKKQKRALRDLITQPTIDRQKVADVQTKINGIHDDLTNMTLAFKLDSLDVMTADQRAQMKHRQLKRLFGQDGHGKRHSHERGLKSS